MKLGELSSKLGIPFSGDASFVVTGVAALDVASASSLCFIQDSSYLPAAMDSKCGVLIVSEKHLSSDVHLLCKNFLIAAQPQLYFAKAAEILHPRPVRSGIHPTAVVSPDACIDSSAWIGSFSVIEEGVFIGRNVRIGAHCYVGSNVQINDDSELHPRVTVMHDVIIGARCRVLPGAVIGSEGFGLVQNAGLWIRVPHLGRVIIDDDVDIGANTTVDRGTLSDTYIGTGVKIDNLVQIAHNVKIGAHSAIAGCAGLAGSSVVGERCLLAGGVGLAGHLELADGVHVTGMSMVTRSITQPGVYSAGTPLDSNKRWRRNAARFKSLDLLARRLQRVERCLGLEKVSEDE
ncbi:MAG: UDP-3-O-(3-hydroxymyristoyl)glucosamine N-acyltransferase [Pseudomonadota bacterium]